MSFLPRFGGGSCLAALQVSFHVLTLENREVSYFFYIFSFYLRSIYDVYQSSRALKFYILYNRWESEQKVTISYMTSNLKLMR